MLETPHIILCLCKGVFDTPYIKGVHMIKTTKL